MKGNKLGETRRQRQPKSKSCEIMKGDKLGDKAIAAAKSEIMKGETSLGDKPAAAAKSKIMKGDKLGRPGGSGSQERSHEGRQAWETSRQRQPKAKS